MKKLRVFFSILLLFTIQLCSQELLAQELKPFEARGLYGYKNNEEEIRITPQYQYARRFNSDYAVIVQNGSLGAIDRENNVIIPPKYEYLKYIGNEKFVFGYRAKYFGEYNLGIINSNNEIIIPALYYQINLRNRHFIVNKQFSTIIDSTGIYDTRSIENKYGIIDTSGVIILKPDFSRLQFLDNDFVIISKELNGKYALLNEEFRKLTDFDYKSFGEFHEGLINVRKEDSCGYLNVEGVEEIECKYETTSIFIDSLAIVRRNGLAGLINRQDEIILDFKFRALGITYNRQITAFNGQKWGVLDLKGDTLLNFNYEHKLSEFKGITAFLKNNEWQIWDYQKENLYPERYDDIKLIEGDESKVLGFGRIEPKKYSQSLAFVKKENKWGVVNEVGELLIPIEHELISLYELIKRL